MRRQKIISALILCILIAIYSKGIAQVSSASWDCKNLIDTTDNKAYIKKLTVFTNGLTDTFNSRSFNSRKQRELFYENLIPSDTVVFVANKDMLKKDSCNYTFRILKNNVLLTDWSNIDFSAGNRVGNNCYKLLKDYPFKLDNPDPYRCTYTIEVKNCTGKNYLQFTYDEIRPVKIWSIFLNEPISKLTKTANSIKYIDENSLALFPQTKWKENTSVPDNTKYLFGEFSRYDTIRVKDKYYYYPHELNITPSDDIVFLLGSIPDAVCYQYKLIEDTLEGNPFDDSIIPWSSNLKGSNLLEIKNIKPGEYHLFIRDIRYPKYGFLFYNITSHSPQKFILFRWAFIKGFIIGLLLVFVVFLIYRRWQKQKMRVKELQRKMIALQVQSFRAQLNPHFIFNALSSIQSLMNKNDLENTNRYLTAFSILLRMTLDERNADLWTLQDELDILDKYISLEQLRFSFDYTIKVGERITAVNIPFPSMLLQPAVENAIKHGISGIKEAGLLAIEVNANKNDLLITITDNGKGFNTNNVQAVNHGIRLTKERIAFINETTEGQRIEMKIESGEQGTVVKFYFYNYIHA